MKVVLTLLVIVAAGVVALMTLGLVVGPPKTPSPEAIHDACLAHFEAKGQKAVQDCTVALIERAAQDDHARTLDEIYRAAKRRSN